MVAALVVVLPILLVIVAILVRGISAINWEFLTAMPRDGMKAGGIFPAIVGTLLLTLKRPQEAAIALEKALMLAPDLGGAQLDYAQALAELGELGRKVGADADDDGCPDVAGDVSQCARLRCAARRVGLGIEVHEHLPAAVVGHVNRLPALVEQRDRWCR